MTGKDRYRKWYARGVDTLKRWLPLYDAGYWLRYDLNPRKIDLWFRITNPYGFELAPLAVNMITLRDPVTGRETSIDAGESQDVNRLTKMWGSDWGKPELLDGRTVRRLKTVTPSTAQDKQEELHAPSTYFYLTLPSEWRDNLRSDWFELFITYKDEIAGNLSVQMRSIAPGPAFRDLRSGDLLLTGSGEWRTWGIPVRPVDLGWWVGQIYAEKHALYLDRLSVKAPELKPWVALAKGYARLGKPPVLDGLESGVHQHNSIKIPVQTVMLPKYDLDGRGVIRQYMALHSNNRATAPVRQHDSESIAQYQPFVVAQQLLKGPDFPEWAHASFDGVVIRREPALEWLLESKNYKILQKSALYTYNFDNTYNDIVTKAPWQSAFSQAYIGKSLLFSLREKLGNARRLKAHAGMVFNAFTYDLKEGGVVSRSKEGLIFAEEIPNATHILIGHLAATNALDEAWKLLSDPKWRMLNRRFRHTLRDAIHFFDTGYWSRYDLNPKKNLIFQLDWQGAAHGPSIDLIGLENPQTGSVSGVDVGLSNDVEGNSRIWGSEWSENFTSEKRNARKFKNGYELRSAPNGEFTRHNVYVELVLPKRSPSDFFDLPAHRLVIRYRDDAVGRLSVKIQKINAGRGFDFVMLREGLIHCLGDGLWKEIVIPVRPQDLGWYSGPEYHGFHVDELDKLVGQFDDWYLRQVRERWSYYLEAYRKSKQVVVEATAEPKLADAAVQYQETTAAHTSAANAGEVLFAASDSRNPLKPLRIPISVEVAAAADAILEGDRSLTPHQKLVRFMRMIGEFRVGPGNGGDPVNILKRKTGACGEFTNLLLALAATQGISGRYVNLHNYPPGDGHTVAEFFIDGKWRLYDPTYGVYYTDTPADAMRPRVLSFEELRNGGGRKLEVTRIIENRERYENQRPLSDEFVGPAIYERADPAGPLDDNRPFLFSLSLNLKTNAALEDKDFGPYVQGADYLGARHECRFHNWTIAALQPGQTYEFFIEPGSIGREQAGGQQPVRFRARMRSGGTLLEGQEIQYSPQARTLMPWRIRFTALSDKVNIHLEHSLCSGPYSYLSIKEYRVRAAALGAL